MSRVLLAAQGVQPLACCQPACDHPTATWLQRFCNSLSEALEACISVTLSGVMLGWVYGCFWQVDIMPGWKSWLCLLKRLSC